MQLRLAPCPIVQGVGTPSVSVVRLEGWFELPQVGQQPLQALRPQGLQLVWAKAQQPDPEVRWPAFRKLSEKQKSFGLQKLKLV